VSRGAWRAQSNLKALLNYEFWLLQSPPDMKKSGTKWQLFGASSCHLTQVFVPRMASADQHKQAASAFPTDELLRDYCCAMASSR
jgi:hypothetical protein